MKTVDFSETIAASDLKVYKAKISGERLQDHWSSGFYFNFQT